MQLAELIQQIAQKANYEKPHFFLDPLPGSQAQHGECCKLYAVQTVMQWLNKTDSAHPLPPPVRRENTLFATESLRHQAKRLFNSQVGEMYDIEALSQLARLNGYDHTYIIQPDHYVEMVMNQLEQGLAPIVFFDIDFDTKGPGFHHSQHEHAAVILGYFHDKDEGLWFLATCWGGYYTYPAEKLAHSAAQLARQRIPELFYKIGGEWRSNQGRYQINKKDTLPVRQGIAPTGKQATFRNKLLVLKSSTAQVDRTAFRKTIDQIQFQVTSVPKLRRALPERDQHIFLPNVPDHFIPLTEVITFFTLNLLRPHQGRFSQQDFEDLFASRDLKQTVQNSIYHVLKAWIDESIEGDIYSQNKHRSRSIVEEISNSIDANPQAIHCTIQDGYYQIREKNGMGMSAATVCTQYLIPKESSKVNSEKQIGRFGIGSFTKLAHLNDANALVVVQTKANDHTGLRLEFRLIHQQIHVALTTDESINEEGTVTQVFSSEINQQEYQAMVSKHIDEDANIPLFINGIRLSKPQRKNQASISINGICIQKSEQDNDCHATSVKWHFPAATTIAEGRDKIIVDHPKTRHLIRQEILKIKDMPHPQWALYANSIAPLVYDLQSTNTSLLAADNLLDFLIQTAHQKLSNAPCAIDTPLYRPLAGNDVVRLHPLLVPKDWVMRIATLAKDWDTNATQVWTAEMVFCEAGEYFLHDKEHDRVFIERNFYEQMAVEGKLKQLERLLSYPPGEINAAHVPQNQSSDGLEHSLPSVTFDEELTRHPWHTLYQQHGLLWLKGEEMTRTLLTSHVDMSTILLQAKTLIAIYPEISFITWLQSTWIRSAPYPLVAFRFANDRYYFHPKDNVLLNERFHPLFHGRWELLKAKMKQLLDSFSGSPECFPEQEITLTAEDILVINNTATKLCKLYNGLGQSLYPSITGKHLGIQFLNESWFLIFKEYGDVLLVHKKDGVLLSLSGYQYSLLNDDTWLAENDGITIKKLYDLNTRSFLFPDAKEILVHDKYLLGKSSSDEWVLGNFSGIHFRIQIGFQAMGKDHPFSV